jgi:2-keto-3-deoxy-L-rhamnonate aldolase RhmA
MMADTLKQRILRQEPLVGTWVKTPAPIVCEVLAKTALDLVCLDAEHAPFDRLTLDHCLGVLRSEAMPALVRLPSAAPEHILNALDCGATGVVIPHVSSAELAASVAQAAHFGAGGRGYAGSTRAAGYTSKKMSDHLSDSGKQTVVVAQIEDAEALPVIDEIAAVDGIDCLFIGRIDLTVALGAASPADPIVIEAVERICAAGVKAGRAVGMFVSDPSEIPHWKECGASLFLLSSDHGFLLQGAKGLVQQFQDN